MKTPPSMGDQIRDARRVAGLTQSTLAARLEGTGMNRDKIAKTETGARPVLVEDVMLIAAALDVAPQQIMPGGLFPDTSTLTMQARRAELMMMRDMIDQRLRELGPTA